MSYKPTSPEDLHAIVGQRQLYYQSQHTLQQRMWNYYNGQMPDEFKDYFPDEMHIHKINTVRPAADDLTFMASKEFPIMVAPLKASQEGKRAAEKVENIAYGWNEASFNHHGTSLKQLMDIWMRNLILTGDAVGMVMPWYDQKLPYFTWRNPLSHLPPPGWSPFTGEELDDTVFYYPMTLKQLMLRYPDKESELRRNYTNTYYGAGIGRAAQKQDEEQIMVMVAEYYCKEAWYVSVVESKVTKLSGSESGDYGHPYCVPVFTMNVFNPQYTKGRSFLADQADLSPAMSRLVSQEIDYADHLLYGPIFTTPTEDDVVAIGTGGVNVWDTTFGGTPRAERISPGSAIQTSQLLAMLMGFARALNKNPEQQISNSAKAMSELNKDVEAVIRDGFWPHAIAGLQRAYKICAEMELSLWPDEKKSMVITGRRRKKGGVVQVDYTPSKDLAGFERRIRLEQGLALGGYAGTLELLQMYGAGTMSLDDLLEQHPFIQNAQETRRKIDADKMKEVLFATLVAKGEQGIIKPEAFHEINRLIEEDEISLTEAIAKVQEQGMLEQAPPPTESPADPLAALLAGAPPAPPEGAAGPMPPLSQMQV